MGKRTKAQKPLTENLKHALDLKVKPKGHFVLFNKCEKKFVPKILHKPLNSKSYPLLGVDSCV